MKDVTSCDKPRGLANTNRSVDFRMGEPNTLKMYYRYRAGRTQGTETSKYLKEKKSIEIARVVVSEIAGA